MKFYPIMALSLALAAAGCGNTYKNRSACLPEQKGQRMCIEVEGKYDLLKCESDFWGKGNFWIPNTNDSAYRSRFERLNDCQIICDAYKNDCITPHPSPEPVTTFAEEVVIQNPNGTVDIEFGTIDFSKLPEEKK